MIAPGGQAPHVLMAQVGHTCGGPNEIELTVAHELLNGSLLGKPLNAIDFVPKCTCKTQATNTKHDYYTYEHPGMFMTFGAGHDLTCAANGKAVLYGARAC